jgi:hypothetical protein
MRWHKLSFFAHLFLALLVLGLTLGATLHLLIDYWVAAPPGNTVRKIHTITGFALTVWVGIQIIGGMAARGIQFFTWVSPQLCNVVKKLHIYSSYLVLIAAKLDYLIINFDDDMFDPTFFAFLAADIVSLMIYIWLKC